MRKELNTFEPRNTGIPGLGPLPWGTHFCCFYETNQDLLNVLVPYFRAGLRNNEFCFWIVSISELLTLEEAKNSLRNELPELDRQLAEGNLEMIGHDEWFLPEGGFDLKAVIRRFEEKLRHALARGYAGMRVNGSSAWLQKKNAREFCEFERELNALVAGQPMIILCTFPLALSSAEEILEAARVHQFTLASRAGRWETVETPAVTQARDEIARRNATLERHVAERTRELAEANERLKCEAAERRLTEEKLLQSREQLRALTARLESLREEERARISREIHDQLGQKLTALKMDLLWAERKLAQPGASAPPVLLDRIVGATELVDESISTVQRIAGDLRPGVLDKLGLGMALRYEARRFQERSGIQCEVRLPETHPEPAPTISTVLFRIFQECLTNVARHAEASKVTVDLTCEQGWVTMRVEDNGRGLYEVPAAMPASLGLLGIKERAALLGGEAVFHNGSRRGFIVTVRIPQSTSAKPL